ncbi:unnamed protein product [Prorocentrum cordatum]|uniref:Mitochondrial inner membrane protease subunit n=1 Tax=Prorocentrum cordatum TaxID=2364126 RepID=A0ABN9S7W9_9DINO|nr:unnamed protein product [Polarella glacialis]
MLQSMPRALQDPVAQNGEGDFSAVQPELFCWDCQAPMAARPPRRGRPRRGLAAAGCGAAGLCAAQTASAAKETLRALPFAVPDCFLFDPILMCELSEAIARAKVLADIAGEDIEVDAAEVWVVSDPSHRRFGEQVEPGILDDAARALQRETRGVVQLDANDAGSEVHVSRVNSNDIAEWKSRVGGGGDPRLLGTFRTAGGKRFLQTKDAVGKLEETKFDDFPFDDPRAAKEYLDGILETTDGSFDAYHRNWCMAAGVSPNSGIAHDRRIILEAMRLGLTYDQINLANSAMGEQLVRRLIQRELAVEKDAKHADYSGLGYMLAGSTDDRGRAAVPKFTMWVAEKQHQRAFTPKQSRLLREERQADEKRRGKGPKGSRGGGKSGAGEYLECVDVLDIKSSVFWSPSEVCTAKDLYTQEPQHMAPYLPEKLKVTKAVLRLATDFRKQIVKSDAELEADRLGGASATPYWCPDLRRSKKSRRELFANLCKRKLLTFRRRIFSRVSIFFVWKKTWMTRLIVHARATNEKCRTPPHADLGTIAALADTDLSLSELSDAADAELTPWMCDNWRMASWFGMDDPDEASPELPGRNTEYLGRSAADLGRPRGTSATSACSLRGCQCPCSYQLLDLKGFPYEYLHESHYGALFCGRYKGCYDRALYFVFGTLWDFKWASYWDLKAGSPLTSASSGGPLLAPRQRPEGRRQRLARPPAVRHGPAPQPRNLVECSVAPGTLRTYKAEVAEFRAWAAGRGLGLRTPESADSAMSDYFDWLFAQRGQPQLGRWTLYGYALLHLSHLGRGGHVLPRAKAALRGWVRQMPGRIRDPCPIEAAWLIAQWMLLKNQAFYFWCSLAVVMQVDTYVRPGALLDIKKEDLVPPLLQRGSRHVDEGLALAPSARTGKTKSGEQDDALIIGILDSAFVKDMVAFLHSSARGGERIFRHLTLPSYEKAVKDACEALELQSLRREVIAAGFKLPDLLKSAAAAAAAFAAAPGAAARGLGEARKPRTARSASAAASSAQRGGCSGGAALAASATLTAGGAASGRRRRRAPAWRRGAAAGSGEAPGGSEQEGAGGPDAGGGDENPVVSWWNRQDVELKEDIKVFFQSLTVALFIRGVFVEPRFIPSLSMYPTFDVGDQLAVDKISRNWRSYERRDVVVFTPPPAFSAAVGEDKSGEALIKRIVALEGDTVEVKNGGQLYINGEVQDEPFTNEKARYNFGPVTVPKGCVFVLGDNRNASMDGHVWGFLPKDDLPDP